MFGCTAGADRRRVAFGLGRSRAAGPGGRTEASRLLLAGLPVATGGPLKEELCRGRRLLLLECWGRSWRTAAAAAAAAVAAAGGGGWLREEEPGPVSAGPPPGRSPGRLVRRGPQARGRCSQPVAGVRIHILTVCRPLAPRAARWGARHSPGGIARRRAVRQCGPQGLCPAGPAGSPRLAPGHASTSRLSGSHGGRRPEGAR